MSLAVGKEIPAVTKTEGQRLQLDGVLCEADEANHILDADGAAGAKSPGAKTRETYSFIKLPSISTSESRPSRWGDVDVCMSVDSVLEVEGAAPSGLETSEGEVMHIFQKSGTRGRLAMWEALMEKLVLQQGPSSAVAAQPASSSSRQISPPPAGPAATPVFRKPAALFDRAPREDSDNSGDDEGHLTEDDGEDWLLPRGKLLVRKEQEGRAAKAEQSRSSLRKGRDRLELTSSAAVLVEANGGACDVNQVVQLRVPEVLAPMQKRRGGTSSEESADSGSLSSKEDDLMKPSGKALGITDRMRSRIRRRHGKLAERLPRKSRPDMRVGPGHSASTCSEMAATAGYMEAVGKLNARVGRRSWDMEAPEGEEHKTHVQRRAEAKAEARGKSEE